MNVNMKYLKDEDGNIISPVTSASSVYNNKTPLSTFLNAPYMILPLTGSYFIYDLPERSISFVSKYSIVLFFK